MDASCSPTAFASFFSYAAFSVVSNFSFSNDTSLLAVLVCASAEQHTSATQMIVFINLYIHFLLSQCWFRHDRWDLPVVSLAFSHERRDFINSRCLKDHKEWDDGNAVDRRPDHD